VRRATASIAAALLAALFLAPAASADNRRVAISDYTWTDTNIQIDLGEHVTWYWVGPDLMHSVTGQPPNATAIDSDPQTNQPQHELGDSFQASFDQPGTYLLQCKLHSTVRGTVTVSPTPGDPSFEPDPIPPIRVDRTPPRLRELALRNSTFGRRGTSLSFSLGERSRVSVEYHRYDSAGKRRFAGFRTFKGHIGLNHAQFGKGSKNFRPRPGRYQAVIQATDGANNTSSERRLRFTIRRR
jgi:plastocyanin